MAADLTKEKMQKALQQLDGLLERPLTLIVGGGGAMLMAYEFPLATSDIDAIPKGYSSEELKPLIERVALDLGYPTDWLNPWFGTFTYVLPSDFQTRLKEVFKGSFLTAQALGAQDLFLMKCFAHRQKDIPHARALMRMGIDVDLIYDQIDALEKKKIPKCKEAREFLDQIVELEEG